MNRLKKRRKKKRNCSTSQIRHLTGTHMKAHKNSSGAHWTRTNPDTQVQLIGVVSFLLFFFLFIYLNLLRFPDRWCNDHDFVVSQEMLELQVILDVLLLLQGRNMELEFINFSLKLMVRCVACNFWMLKSSGTFLCVLCLECTLVEKSFGQLFKFQTASNIILYIKCLWKNTNTLFWVSKGLATSDRQ